MRPSRAARPGVPGRATPFLAAAAALLLAPLACAAPDRPAAASTDARLREVGCVGVTVSDLDRAVDFYAKVLSFERVAETEEAGVHWQTTLFAGALDEAAGALRGAGAAFVSRGIAALGGSRLGLARAALVRDPDGHALLVAEAASP